MFRALLCSLSGGQIVLLQHLVSSLSVGGRCPPTECNEIVHEVGQLLRYTEMHGEQNIKGIKEKYVGAEVIIYELN
jgi:hypothetical protein